MTNLSLNNLTDEPVEQIGYSDYYNDNNFIGAGVDNQIINSQRCSILQGSSNYISGKYNCHVIGDNMGNEFLEPVQYGGVVELHDNSLNIGCYNGTYSWGPIFAKAGILVYGDALFGEENEVRIGSSKNRELIPDNFLPDTGAPWEGNEVGFIDFDGFINAQPGGSQNFKHNWNIRIHNGFDQGSVGGNDDSTNLFISSHPDSTISPNLYVEGDVVAYYSSDERLKDNILSIDNCLNKVMSLDAVSFDWNKKQNAYSGHDIGLIAQQVNEVAPEIVEERKDGYLALKYEKMVPLLVGAIKDQQKIIDEMREEIKELKNQITR
jgi:hypothetical protein